MKILNKFLIILLWLIILPIIIILANYRFFYFINDFNNLIIFTLFIISFSIIITLSIIFGFRDVSNNDNLNINYERDPIKELFDLAQKYHLDLEINDAIKVYEEIKEKYPNTIHEKKAQIEINRILGKNKVKKSKKSTDKALEILRIGYAKGEITKEDFEQRKKDLET